MKITVTNTQGLPTLTATGYIGQSPDDLKADLAHRREMLDNRLISREYIICTGPDFSAGGLNYIDVGNYN